MTIKQQAYCIYLLLNTNILIISHFNLNLLLKIGRQGACKVWEWMEDIGVMGVFPWGDIGQANVKYEFIKRVKMYFTHYKF